MKKIIILILLLIPALASAKWEQEGDKWKDKVVLEEKSEEEMLTYRDALKDREKALSKIQQFSDSERQQLLIFLTGPGGVLTTPLDVGLQNEIDRITNVLDELPKN